MKILCACEFSQTICQAFRRQGHEAYSCDLLPTEGNPEWHNQCDVRDILGENWDLIIAHPDCTYLCNSGVRWLHTQEGRWEKLKEAREFFNLFLNHPCAKVCVENPIPHKYTELPKYTQIVHPWEHGHGEQKSTCLWLKGLPNLIPTNVVEGREQRIWKMGPSKDRWKERSRTFKGIAEAMASQWG